MVISYSVSNEINHDLVDIGTEDPNLVFPAIYGLPGFGYTITFSDSLYTITNVNVTNSPLFVNTTLISPDKVRVEKNSLSIFTNESYDFAIFDESFNKTVENYTSSELESVTPNSSVFAWNTPSIRAVTGSYTFEITYINTSLEPPINETITKTYTQDYVWSATAGTQTLLNLVNESKY
jgi:hypothetical protein